MRFIIGFPSWELRSWAVLTVPGDPYDFDTDDDHQIDFEWAPN